MRKKRGPYRIPRPEVTQPLNESYRYIPLTQGQVAIVDLEDFDKLSAFNWYAAWSNLTDSFYACRCEGTKPNHRLVRMHWAVMGTKWIDHIGHNTLDNRKQNLRKATQQQNARNARKSRRNTSGYIGVSVRADGRYLARVMFNRKSICVGIFADPQKAAKARDKVAKQLHGEFASLNF